MAVSSQIFEKPSASVAPGKTDSVALRLDNVRKEFPERSGKGTVTAVDDVSLDITHGEFVTLLGPSGCGKTTTLRLIAGFEMPTRGRILLNDKDVTFQPPNKRDMALVFQNYALFPHMTVYGNVAYGLQTRGLGKAEVNRRVTAALDLMELGNLGDRRPNQLSGGQQQRVALARSLVMEPAILLFDEPLSNLDAKLRVQMRSDIHALQRRLNITSVYVTHDQIEAMALSDRIVVMNQGLIEQMGSPEQIYRYPVSRFVAGFIGRANFIESPVETVDTGKVRVNVLGQQHVVPISFPYKDGDTVLVMLRPEALSLVDDPTLPQGLVEQAMYLGSEIEYIAQIDGSRLIIVENDPRASRIFAEGLTVGIDVVEEAIHLVPKV